MSDKATANNDNRVDHAKSIAHAPKPVKRDEPALIWPSASTSGGGAYITTQGPEPVKSEG